MSAFPEALAYQNLPRKSMGSRVSKVQIAPRNGSSFNAGGNIQIQLPTLPSSYINLSNSYLKFKVKAVGNACHLDHTAYSLFSRMTTTSQGAVIDDTTGLNVLYSALLDLGVGSATLRDYGAIALGSDGKPEQSHLGAQLDTTAYRGCALPFFTGLFAMDGKLLPLDTADGVVFTLYLETALNSLIADAHNSLPTGFVIEDVSLHAYILSLTPESQSLLDQVVDNAGGYTMMFESVAHSSDSKAVGELTKISTLGFRYSSLSRVLMTMRASDNEGDGEQLSISNRSTAKLSEVGLLIGGEAVPSRPITCDVASAGFEDFSEPLSETLLSFGVLGDKYGQLGLNGITQDRLTNDASTDDAFSTLHNRYVVENGHLADDKDYADIKLKNFAGMGSFVVAIDTDIVKNVSSNPDAMYSGISTLGSTVQSRLKFSGASTNAQTIDYFGFYNSIMTLNPITRSFEVNN